MAIGELITGATQGSVLFAGVGGVLAQHNAGFQFDDANNVLKSANAATAASSQSLTISTGVGGPGNSGSPPAGNSGDLFLRTGTGGSDPFGTAGSGGSIIIQPGTSGGGSNGAGGSTIVRAPANLTGNIFAIQSDTGGVTHWAAASDGSWIGTKPIHTTHNS
jgi:hypothetical protein